MAPKCIQAGCSVCTAQPNISNIFKGTCPTYFSKFLFPLHPNQQTIALHLTNAHYPLLLSKQEVMITVLFSIGKYDISLSVWTMIHVPSCQQGSFRETGNYHFVAQGCHQRSVVHVHGFHPSVFRHARCSSSNVGISSPLHHLWVSSSGSSGMIGRIGCICLSSNGAITKDPGRAEDLGLAGDIHLMGQILDG